MILHDYWRSSAAYRVRIALNLCGLAYESRPVDLVRGDHRAAANRARNPQGLVPTLEIDGLVLTQSLAIAEYLGETRGPPLVPGDAPGRARVRALAHAIAMEIAPVCNLSVRNRAAAISGGAVTADDWVRPVMQAGLAAFEALLDHPATGRFCHGDAVTLADLCLVPQIYNARRIGLDLAPLPRITAVTAALEALPAFAAAHPDRHAPKEAKP
jgi:maleylacetoacetate isomerase